MKGKEFFEIIYILQKINEENRRLEAINNNLGLSGKVIPDYITYYNGVSIQDLKLKAIDLIYKNLI